MPSKSKEAIFWADSKDKLRSFPQDVRIDIGHALTLVENGGAPLRFDHVPELGPGLMEIKASFDKETYRAFYVARFPEAVYILDAIHKKSTKGKGLPRGDKERIQARYKTLMAYRATLS